MAILGQAPSDVRVTPDGAYCLVAASFDDRVKVINTATNTIVADLEVGDFPIQIAFNDDGSRAIVSNYSGDSYSIIEVDGASSSVLGTWNCGNGPLRVAYDSYSDQFAVGLHFDKAVKTVDPSTGSITSTYSYASFGYINDVGYAADGSRLVLTMSASPSVYNKIHRESENVNLPGKAMFFDYSDVINAAVVVVPGPDYCVVVFWTPNGIEEGVLGMSGIPGLSISPNPGSVCFAFDVELPSDCDVRLGIYDLSGRFVSTVEQGFFASGFHAFSFDASLPSGVYAVRLDAGNKTVTRLMTVCDQD